MSYGTEQQEAIIEDGFTAAIPLKDNEFITGRVERTDAGVTSQWTVRVEGTTDSTRSPGPQGGPWSDVPLKFNVVLATDKVILFFASHQFEVRIGIGQSGGSDAVTATVYWRIGQLFPI